MIRRILFAALALAAAPALAQDGRKSAEAALGEAFCLVKDFPETAGPAMLVTPSLEAEIRKAAERSDQIAKAHPDEKPPLGDGVPYQSFPDVAPACEVGAISGQGPGAVVEIRHRFPQEPGADFTDRLVLGQGWHDGILGIDDVLYGAEGSEDGLRKVLKGVME